MSESEECTSSCIDSYDKNNLDNREICSGNIDHNNNDSDKEYKEEVVEELPLLSKNAR